MHEGSGVLHENLAQPWQMSFTQNPELIQRNILSSRKGKAIAKGNVNEQVCSVTHNIPKQYSVLEGEKKTERKFLRY